MGQRADGELADAGQAFGQQPQHHAFSGARITTDEGKTAFTHQAVLDAPAEAVDLAREPQGFGRQLR